MNIYCVDDNQMYLNNIKEVMELACKKKNITNHRIFECADGEQVIEKARLNEPSFITLDINMPNLDGLSALVRLRDKYPECVIVMVSSENRLVVKRHSKGSKYYNTEDTKKYELLDKVVARVKSGLNESGKFNSVLEACASLGMDPVTVAKYYGANAFINKPFDIEETSRDISNLLPN